VPLRLEGDFVRCGPGCGRLFDTTEAYFQHLMGHRRARRCMRTDELIASGYRVGPDNVWRMAEGRPPGASNEAGSNAQSRGA
jgi:hypothetical protein